VASVRDFSDFPASVRLAGGDNVSSGIPALVQLTGKSDSRQYNGGLGGAARLSGKSNSRQYNGGLGGAARRSGATLA